eukprot:31208-Pelagococcus_subviridis.AAC.8
MATTRGGGGAVLRPARCDFDRPVSAFRFGGCLLNVFFATVYTVYTYAYRELTAPTIWITKLWSRSASRYLFREVLFPTPPSFVAGGEAAHSTARRSPLAVCECRDLRSRGRATHGERRIARLDRSRARRGQAGRVGVEPRGLTAEDNRRRRRVVASFHGDVIPPRRALPRR